MPEWRRDFAHALQIDMVDLAGVAPIIIYLAAEDVGGDHQRPGALAASCECRIFPEASWWSYLPVGVERCITPGAPDA